MAHVNAPLLAVLGTKMEDVHRAVLRITFDKAFAEAYGLYVIGAEDLAVCLRAFFPRKQSEGRAAVACRTGPMTS